VQGVETARSKYVFFDVVGYTRNRSVEAQTYIIATLNSIVREVLAAAELAPENIVLIPTGDGMCIALLTVDSPFDVELQVAVGILRRLTEHNLVCEDVSRRFDIRVGLNENIDNVVIDVNGHRNMAGAGISMAARLMDLADGGQVLVSQTVYDRLRNRELYLNAFRSYRAVSKHQTSFFAFQYLGEGVNVSVPDAFQQRRTALAKMPMEVAFYLCESRLNRAQLMQHKDITENPAITVLLWFRASEAADRHRAKEIDVPRRRLPPSAGETIDEQLAYLKQAPIEILIELARDINQLHLASFDYLFEDQNSPFGPRFANQRAVGEIRSEWPEVAESLHLDQ
jgi:class 3 adenylate cyclase